MYDKKNHTQHNYWEYDSIFGSMTNKPWLEKKDTRLQTQKKPFYKIGFPITKEKAVTRVVTSSPPQAQTRVRK